MTDILEIPFSRLVLFDKDSWCFDFPHTRPTFHSIKAPSMWSGKPETTLPAGYSGRGSRTRLVGRDISDGRVVSPRQAGLAYRTGRVSFK